MFASVRLFLLRLCLVLILIGTAVFLIPNQRAFAQTFNQSHAIVIGIDRYQGTNFPDLAFAVADARRVAGFLQNAGYRVTLLLDQQASRENIINVVRQAGQQLGAEGRLLFYYGGHGHTETLGDDEVGYLVTHGARSVGAMLSVDELRELSGQLGRVRHQLFVLNSCYGGTIGMLRGVMRGLDRKHPEYLTQISTRNARQFISAGGPDQQVLDGGPGGLSWFTHYFLEATESGQADLDGDGVITFPEMSAYLLPRASNSQQTPTSGALPGHALGEYFFAAGKTTAAQAPRVTRVEPPKITTTATRALPFVEGSFIEMQQPIHRLYAAWEDLDLEAYKAQWSPTAIQYIGRSKKRGVREIFRRRAKLFPRLASVTVDRYQLWFRAFEDGVASFDASYAMSFYFADGRVIREQERETYKTRQVNGRWVIQENRDYIR